MNEILVVTDSSKTSSQIISFAVDIAKKMNSYITLAWVNNSVTKDIDSDKALIQNKYDEIVNEYSEILDSSYFELRIIFKNPSIEILKLINNLEIDMVFIKKYDGKSAFNKIFNDYPLQIQAQIECPIFIFPINYIYNKKLSSIILPIDANKNTQQKIPLATIFSKKFDSEINAIFFNDDKYTKGSLEQKKQCEEYMVKYKVGKFKYTNINSSLNIKSVLKINNYCSDSIIIIMNKNYSDSVFKKYTFTQKLIIESYSPVLSVSAYKTKSVKSKKYFKL